MALGLASDSGTGRSQILAWILNPRRRRLAEFVNLLKDKVVGRLRETCLVRFFGNKLGVGVIILGSAF